MSARRRRFASLVRHFAYRFVDHDPIAVEGNGYPTLVHVLALLGAFRPRSGSGMSGPISSFSSASPRRPSGSSPC